jgi:hypothetical protein
MKNLFYVFSVSFLKYRLAKNLITCLTIILILLPQQNCNTTGPDEKPPSEPDSTTQNFIFENFEVGNGSSSSWLEDVWIFDENNIWAVGYINSTPNTGRVNIIRWDGSRWLGVGSQFNSAGIYGIWAIDTSNIYFAVGVVLKYKNGVFSWEDFNHINFPNYQSVNKLWGSSESNIWGVGPNGTIVHYDGTNWSKIDFDINYRFDAITGSKQTGIAYASATSQQFNTIIVELKNNSATVIYNSANNSENLTSFSIEQLNEQELILGTTSVWTFNVNTKETKILYTVGLIGNYISLSALNSPIDVYFFIDKYGEGEDLLHHNGKRFSTINFSSRNHVIYGGAYAIKDLAVMVGYSNNKGYIVKVKRIN